MAITTFIPQIWESSLLKGFYEGSVANVITTAPSKIEGDTITFNKVSNVAINDYSGTVSFAELTTSKIDLKMAIKKYFAFKVDDVDAIQAAGDLIGPHTFEAANKMQMAMDQAVLDKALTASGTLTKETGENIYDVIVKCNMALNKKKVPKRDRFCVINAESLADLQLDARFTEHYEILENGIIQGAKINGVQLIFSEELNHTDSSKEAVCVLHKSAVGFGTQLRETEALRLEGSFADGVRGLQVAGCEILRDEAIAFYKKTGL